MFSHPYSDGIIHHTCTECVARWMNARRNTVFGGVGWEWLVTDVFGLVRPRGMVKSDPPSRQSDGGRRIMVPSEIWSVGICFAQLVPQWWWWWKPSWGEGLLFRVSWNTAVGGKVGVLFEPEDTYKTRDGIILVQSIPSGVFGCRYARNAKNSGEDRYSGGTAKQ